MILVIMGVCGSGKTTVGSCLGNKLGWTFYDADDYHPKRNIDKMSSGIPLNDQDRVPWLQILHDIIIREWSSGRNVILACSALKKLYRQIMAMGSEILDSVTDEEKFPRKDLLFVYLHGTIELITKRLAARKGHYMAENLIQSQFDVLEPPAEPENFITVEIAKSIPEIVAEIENALCNHGNCSS